MKRITLAVAGLLLCCMAHADHIVGAEIFYDYHSSNTYTITLKFYRNCSTTCNGCAPYANPDYLSIFSGHSSNIFSQPPVTFSQPSPISSNWGTTCGSTFDLCVEEADYTATVVLPPSDSGYTIVYQRCCRNASLANLEDNQGLTVTASIPPPASAINNNSARFDTLESLFFCLNQPFTINDAAFDPDGDSLVYSLGNPLQGASATCPEPTPDNVLPGCPTAASPPPYVSCIYTLPYSDSNFINNPSTNANVRINPVTGIVTGIANTTGLFNITVYVNEFRNGILINTAQRDLMYYVLPCLNNSLDVVTAGDDTIICMGSQVQLGSPAAPDVIYQWQDSAGFSSTQPQVIVTPGQTTIYTLSATDTVPVPGCVNNTESQVTVFVEPQPCTLAINSYNSSNADIKLYPNPAAESVHIFSGNPGTGPVTIEIFNQLGQRVLTQQLNLNAQNTTINTAGLQNGLYTYRLLSPYQPLSRGTLIIAD